MYSVRTLRLYLIQVPLVCPLLQSSQHGCQSCGLTLPYWLFVANQQIHWYMWLIQAQGSREINYFSASLLSICVYVVRKEWYKLSIPPRALPRMQELEEMCGLCLQRILSMMTRWHWQMTEICSRCSLSVCRLFVWKAPCCDSLVNVPQDGLDILGKKQQKRQRKM